MGAVSRRQLAFWKFLACVGFSLAATALAWAYHFRRPDQSANQSLPQVNPDEAESAPISAFRQANQDDSIVLSIEELSDVGNGSHNSNVRNEQWVRLEPAPTTASALRNEFPIPTFNAHHHHH